jgi:hypothetical protein
VSFAARRRIVIALVVGMALWPALHFPLMRALDLNPWNWFGWAMYTQPAERIQVSYHSLDGAALGHRSLGPHGLEALKRAYGPWSRRYLQIHGFAPPDELARVLLRHLEGWDGVVVRVERIGLERESARIAVLRTEEYTYRRAEWLGR